MAFDADVRPFLLEVPDSEVDELRRRLDLASVPTDSPGAAGLSGLSMERLDGLLRYWRETFDWRAQERRINRLPHVLAEVHGQQVHAIVAPAEPVGGRRPLPIILSHGWPYSPVEMTRIVPALTAAGMEVVIPSLPGFGWSDPFTDRPFTSTEVARLWHALMTEVLGHERYLSYGEDVGTLVSDRLAATQPEAVAGLFATHAAFAPASRAHDLSPEESAWRTALDKRWSGATGYASIQATRPDLLAAALLDSPLGLAAWVVEKLLAWSGERPERWWSDDDLLTTVCWYWFSGSIGTSFRPYLDDPHETEMPLIDVPVSVLVQHGERGFPRHHAARTYRDIRSWAELEDGGHFAAWQNAEEVARGIVELEAAVA
ncbi:epoxide hydrolase family protein [Brevibacterium album]|uniref:epoxide hydrolase family protein n=1 Tax=Brevibacterium album TaxID=417948 RepID=UPI000428668F|nr:epoxide hydrolase family protein [Brevibacterium album]